MTEKKEKIINIFMISLMVLIFLVLILNFLHAASQESEETEASQGEITKETAKENIISEAESEISENNTRTALKLRKI